MEPGEELENYAPFHISVAATAIHNGEDKIWDSGNKVAPELNLTKDKARELLEYLDQKQNEGFAICAWNGPGFDFQWLGRQKGTSLVMCKY